MNIRNGLISLTLFTAVLARKLSWASSLKSGAVLLVLFAICLSVPVVAVQNCPKGAKGTPPWLLDEKCKRWRPNYDISANKVPEALAQIPKNCGYDGNNQFKCYWSNAQAACSGYLKLYKIENPSSNNTKTKFLPGGQPSTYNCSIYNPDTDRPVPSNQPYPTFTIIHLEEVIPQSHCGSQVTGPYSGCAPGGDMFTLCGTQYNEAQKGFNYTSTQKQSVRVTNKMKYQSKKERSDFADYCYRKPAGAQCFKKPASKDECRNENTVGGIPLSDLCIEPEFLNTQAYKADSPEVHHVIPKKDIFGCRCGKNSMANAVVISRQLNQHFLNFVRPADEIGIVNQLGMRPYPCAAQMPSPPPPMPSGRAKRN